MLVCLTGVSGNMGHAALKELVLYDKIDKLRGMDIIFVTTAKTNKEAEALLKAFGMPYRN